MVIDSHQHFWKYDATEYEWIDDGMTVLKQDYLPNDLAALTTEAGVNGVVSVQARESLGETDFLLEHALKNDLVRGVVGWVPCKDPGVGEIVDRYLEDPHFKGIREITQGKADADFYENADFDRGIRELTKRRVPYDILIYEDQLPAAARFVDRHPNQSFILDHIGKPVIRADKFSDAWAHGLREIAQRENIVCKFSGVVTEVRDRSWDSALIRPHFETALETFGADRLMFGSDWPVCLLRAEYLEWVKTVRTLTEALSDDEKTAFFGGTAAKAYDLGG